MGRSNMFSLLSGQTLGSDLQDYQAASVAIDNNTNQWLLEQNLGRWVAPFMLGVRWNFTSRVPAAAAIFTPPPGLAQLAVVPGQKAILTYSEDPTVETPGVPSTVTIQQAGSQLIASDFQATGIHGLSAADFAGSISVGPPAFSGDVAGQYVIDTALGSMWVWSGARWTLATPSVYSARAYLSAAQTIPSGTANTKLALDTVGGVVAAGAGFSYDRASMFDAVNHRFKAPIAGFYSATGLVSGTDQANPQTWQANLAQNDVLVVANGSSYLTRGANAGDLCVSLVKDDEIFLNANDTLALFVSTVMTNAVAVITGAPNCYLCIQLQRAV